VIALAIRYYNDSLLPKDIKQMLKKVPAKLDNVYKHILRKVINKKDYLQTLRLMR
jgi:hypothetical protein